MLKIKFEYRDEMSKGELYQPGLFEDFFGGN